MAANTTSVEYEKDALVRIQPLYRMIRDCIAGAKQIKDARTLYLPHPDPMFAEHKVGIERYNSYATRAVFYNITGNTVKGMLGQIFSRDPVIKLPTLLEPMLEDVSGSGMSLAQQSRQAAEDVIALGRHGLLTEYPRVEDQTSQYDLDSGNVRPIILNFKPEDIINWRESFVGNLRRYTLIILRDKADSEHVLLDDDFSEDKTEVFRELRLIADENGANHTYWSRFWVQEGESGALIPDEWVQPLDATRKPFTEIPFSFIGSDNNDSTIDEPPMRDIAELNIAHFRNSADYEESVFMLGQPTPYLSGLTIQWVKEVLKDTPIILGSRVAVKLPQGATMGLLQAEPNTMASEAMDKKERQMVSLGARIVEQREVQRTAKEYGGDKATQSSILATISRNVSAAYLKCLMWACQYSGASFDGVEFELNTDFELAKMTPEEVAQVIAAWQTKAISFTEMRFALKKGGVAYQEDEDMRSEADSDPNARGLDLDKEPEEEGGNPPDDDSGQNNPPEDD